MVSTNVVACCSKYEGKGLILVESGEKEKKVSICYFEDCNKIATWSA
jgi:hypothetical protein